MVLHVCSLQQAAAHGIQGSKIIRDAASQVTCFQPTLQVSWSPTGDAFLVVTSYSQVRCR